jgi:soluble lytic murein transglycosylase-like protein
MRGTSRQGTGVRGGTRWLAATWAGAVSFAFASGVHAADVYASVAADGTVSYANQALDPSYTLLFTDGTPGELPRAIPKPPKASPQAVRMRGLIAELARVHGVPTALVEAVVAVESGFDARAVSSKGARGPMQLMPATGRRYGLLEPGQFHLPQQNIDAGIRHLKDLLARHNGNLALALAAYNAGSGAVQKHGDRIPPYPETMLYVPAVLGRAAAAQP